MIDPIYVPRIRAERVIAAGRVVLAVFSLVAILLDPSTPTRYVQVTYLLLSLYAGYAVVLGLVVWRSRIRVRAALVSHVVDLLCFSVFMYLTEGPASPFFVYFTFALVSATLRWQWRGALWTAVAALGAFGLMGLYAVIVVRDPAFELNRFIIRTVYLMVMTSLLGYLGAYEHRLRREMFRLAAWPRMIPVDHGALSQTVVEHAAAILGAPRVLLVWEDPDEPWCNLALWSHGEFRNDRASPGVYSQPVAEPLVNSTFMAEKAHMASASVLLTSSEGLRTWRGSPINAELRSRFDVRSVLYMRIRGEWIDGHLFSMDKAGMTADDLVLGRVVARLVAASMDHFLLSLQLREAAATEERIRLARDLHDGVLQSLTGAALQLRTVQGLWETEPDTARERLVEVERLIADEQRDLSFFIRELRPGVASTLAGRGDLEARLRELMQRLEGVWNLHVALEFESVDADAVLSYEVYRLVQEALVNVARHASASEARVSICRNNEVVQIVVADNGRGFPFRGQYDHSTLAALQLGPLTLRERVTALGGTLAIDSTSAGARLDIRVPISPSGG